MVSQNKLIKEGIRYTDALFEEISKRLEQGVRSSDTLEEFLEKTKEYTKANPLATSEYDKTMLNLILSETNNHKFSRPAQKELVRVTIEEKVGEKIHDVGEDIKDSVRDIVKHGYNNNLPQEKIAEDISNRVSSIKNRRARAIARTEIARAATVSDYIINKERGATGWYVECRNTACPICKKAWHKKWTPENDDSFNPSDKTAGGNGWVGDKIYSMEDTKSLPPVHPNCRCVVYYIADSKGRVSTKPFPKPATNTSPASGGELPIPTPAQLKKNLRPGEREKYNSYQRNIVLQRAWLKDNPNASAEDIAKHRKRLAFLEKKFNELKRKALGNDTDSGSKPKVKPKTTAKPKTNKPKTTPKPKEKPEAKPKEKPKKEPKTKSEKLPEPTSKQLKENLTPSELKRYKRYQKEIKENKMSPEFIEMRKKEVENFKRKALGLKPVDNNVTILSAGNSEFGGKQLTAKELRSKLSKKQYDQFQKYADDIIRYNEKLKRLEKDNPKRIPFEKKIQLRMGQLDRLEQEAINPTKVRSESKTPKNPKPKVTRDLEKPFDTSKHLTKEQLDKMDFKQLAEHHNVEYKGVEVYDYDGKKYHMFEQTCANGEPFTIYFEDSAVKSYAKAGIATPNEIIHEVFKVPEALRKETNEIWFKNSVKGIRKNYGKSKYDSLAVNEGGYNLSWRLDPRTMDHYDSPDHKIVINPNYFKRTTKRVYLPQTKSFAEIDEELGWRHALFHEFTHSGDKTRENWQKKSLYEISFMEEYDAIEKEEPYFTSYANSKRVESFAEHGGFIARMEANPKDHNKKIKIELRDDNRRHITKYINYKEYKEMYPKHYQFFMKKFKEGF